MKPFVTNATSTAASHWTRCFLDFRFELGDLLFMRLSVNTPQQR
jgi:hypothetical protein